METISLNAIVEIVREAAQYMLTDSFEITQKDGYTNIVTSSDVAVQEFLCGKLSQLLPGSGFLCEEEDMQDNSHEYTWIIDPIDGTANYSRGVDTCAICVGLKHHEEMECGVVYLPRTNEMFSAQKGKGAFRNGRQIHVSQRPFENAILCTALPVYHKEYARLCGDIILDAISQCNDFRRFGACAPELCYVAMGRFELFYEYLLSPWDYAAASIILTEAGGVITARDGSKLDISNPGGLVAGNNPESHARILSIVRKHTGE